MKTHLPRHKFRHFFLAICLLTLLPSVAWVADPEIEIVNDDDTKQVDLSKAYAHLEQQWREGKVDLVEILHVSVDREFPGNASSAMVEAYHDFRLIIRDPKESTLAKDIVAAVAKTKAAPSGKVADVRWGCLFRTHQNAKIFSVYFDRTGRKGVVNGACVNFQSDALQKCITSNLTAVFR